MYRPLFMAFGILLSGSVVLCSQTTPAASTVPEQAAEKKRSIGSRAGSQAVTTTGQAAGQASYHVKISTAQQQIGRGDLEQAMRTSQEAQREAQAAGDTQAQADAAITYARTLEIKNGAKTTPAQMVEVLSAYEEAARVGDPKQRATALNSRGVVLLRNNKPAEALTSLKQVDTTAVANPSRLGYRYNLARAYELNGPQYSRESYTAYVQVLKERPGYRPALEGAFRVLLRDPVPRIGDAVALGMDLLSAGQTESAGQYMRRSLEQWANQPDSQKLLAVLLRYYASVPVETEQFKKTEWPWMQHIASTAPRLEKPIAEVGKAYSDDIHPVFEWYEAWSLFPAWSQDPWQRQAIGALLKSIGVKRQQQNLLEQALTHYTLAWFLDPTDSESAVNAAALLRDHKQLLDTQATLFNRLLKGIFEVKGMAYNQQDWPNILRLHTILGTIFEREQKWGPDDDPRSAIFQWKHAIQAEGYARQKDPNLLPSPGLYLKLANAYRATNRPEMALKQYLAATEGYLKFSDPDGAKTALEQIRSLPITLPQEDGERMRSLELQVSQLSG